MIAPLTSAHFATVRDVRVALEKGQNAVQIIANREAEAVAPIDRELQNEQRLHAATASERDQLRAFLYQCYAWKVRIDAERDRALERAAEAEAELAKMEQSYTDEVQRRFKDVDALSTALAKERGRAAIHESFCNDALALCEDTGIAGNIIAKMRELRSDAIDAALKDAAAWVQATRDRL